MSIFYHSLDINKLDQNTISTLNYPDILDEMESWEKIHGSIWGVCQEIHPFFTLYKEETLFEHASFDSKYHLIFYDAFGPAVQPFLWELPVLRNFVGALVPGGVLVTYCVKGTFRRNLASLGMDIERLPGPPGKREMLRATKIECGKD